MGKTIKYRNELLFINYCYDITEAERDNILIMRAFGSINSKKNGFSDLIGKSITFKKAYWTENDYKEIADNNVIQDNNRLTNIYPLVGGAIGNKQEFIRQLKKLKPYDIEIIIEEAEGERQ